MKVFDPLLVLLTATAPRGADTGTPPPAGCHGTDFDDSDGTAITVPHNWDRYEGLRQLKHGDRHDPITFPNDHPPGRWSHLRSRTGSSLNTGHYRLRLQINRDQALALGPLEVE